MDTHLANGADELFEAFPVYDLERPQVPADEVHTGSLDDFFVSFSHIRTCHV